MEVIKTRKYTLKELEKMPTISIGQADDLKIEEDGVRVWLCRCGVADGMDYENQVTIEKYIDGHWAIVEEYEAL